MADGSGEGRDALSGRRGPDGTGSASGVAEQGLAVAEHHGELSRRGARPGQAGRDDGDPKQTHFN